MNIYICSVLKIYDEMAFTSSLSCKESAFAASLPNGCQPLQQIHFQLFQLEQKRTCYKSFTLCVEGVQYGRTALLSTVRLNNKSINQYVGCHGVIAIDLQQQNSHITYLH